MPAKSSIASIDIGTDTTKCLLAQLDQSQPLGLSIAGVAVIPSKGMRKSQIVNLEEVIATVQQALVAAERMAGFSAQATIVGTGGPQITSQNSKGVVAVADPNQEIIPDDVARVVEAAKTIPLPPDKEVIHVIPRDFTVDSQNGIKDPVGMTGIRLEAETHLILTATTTIKNTEKTMTDLGLPVSGFVFAGLAAAGATLTDTEKELGVVAVDIGSGSTSICAYVDGSVAFSSSIPIGARHITQDIALGCRLSLEAAEKIKLELSSHPPHPITRNPGESKESVQARRKKDDELDLLALGIHEGNHTMSKKTVIEGIMVPRLKELVSMVLQKLRTAGVYELTPAGLVFSGGGAQTVGLTELSKRVLNLPARVATLPKAGGIVHDLDQPTFAVCLGLLLHAKHHQLFSARQTNLTLPNFLQPLQKIQTGNLIAKINKLISSLLP